MVCASMKLVNKKNLDNSFVDAETFAPTHFYINTNSTNKLCLYTMHFMQSMEEQLDIYVSLKCIKGFFKSFQMCVCVWDDRLASKL